MMFQKVLGFSVLSALVAMSSFAGTEVTYGEKQPIEGVFATEKVVSYLDQASGFELVGVRPAKAATSRETVPGYCYSSDEDCWNHVKESDYVQVVQVQIRYASHAWRGSEEEGGNNYNEMLINLKPSDFSQNELVQIQNTKGSFLTGFNTKKNRELVKQMFVLQVENVNPYKEVVDTAKSKYCDRWNEYGDYDRNCHDELVYKTIFAPDSLVKVNKR